MVLVATGAAARELSNVVGQGIINGDSKVGAVGVTVATGGNESGLTIRVACVVTGVQAAERCKVHLPYVCSTIPDLPVLEVSVLVFSGMFSE